MARYRSDAFPCCRPWQDIAPMRSRRGLGREKHRFVATYRLHVFRFSLFWQDMRAMHPKSPAERRWGMHRASILPPRGVFAVRSPQIMHGARILPPSGGPAPAQGLLPEQLHRRIVLQRLGPCPGGGAYPQRLANTCHSLYPPLALQTQPNTSSWARWLLPKKRNGARQRIKVWKRQLGFRYKQRLAFEGCVMPSTRCIS